MKKNIPFRCDAKGCNRFPYMEMYDLDEHKWYYLCRIHYIIDRLKNGNKHGYAKVDTVREMLDGLRQDLFNLELEVISLRIDLEEKDE